MTYQHKYPTRFYNWRNLHLSIRTNAPPGYGLYLTTTHTTHTTYHQLVFMFRNTEITAIREKETA